MQLKSTLLLRSPSYLFLQVFNVSIINFPLLNTKLEVVVSDWKVEEALYIYSFLTKLPLKICDDKQNVYASLNISFIINT